MPSAPRYGPQLREEAFRLYVEHRSVRKVGELLGLRHTTIGKWSVAEKWVERVSTFDATERERIEDELHAEATRRRRVAIRGIGRITTIAERRLELAELALSEERTKKLDAKVLAELEALSPAALETFLDILERAAYLEQDNAAAPPEKGADGGAVGTAAAATAVVETTPEGGARATLSVASSVRCRLGIAAPRAPRPRLPAAAGRDRGREE